MRHVCINCHCVWGDGINDIKEHTADICPECMEVVKTRLTEIYRTRQRKEGNPDCFYKSFGNCAKTWCIYYEACVLDIFREIKY